MRTIAGLRRSAGKYTATGSAPHRYGTPQEILEKMEKRCEQIGRFDLTLQVSYGGLTGEQAEQSIRLFAKEVQPEFQSWGQAG